MSNRTRVRQGCSLSPLLFIIYDEAMVKEATAKEELGVKVGGQVISMIRCADDKAVVASSDKNLQRLMDNVSRVTQEYGMKINVKKTKTQCAFHVRARPKLRSTSTGNY